MKKEICLMCVVCFLLGYFIADILSKCCFSNEYYTQTLSASPFMMENTNNDEQDN